MPRTVRAAWQDRLAGEIEAYVNSLHADAVRNWVRLSSVRWTQVNDSTCSIRWAGDAPTTPISPTVVRPTSTFVIFPPATMYRTNSSFWPGTDSCAYWRATYRRPDTRRPNPRWSGLCSDRPCRHGRRENVTMENRRVRIGLDADGAISSLIAKGQSDTELAATIAGLKLNDLAAHETSGSPHRGGKRGAGHGNTEVCERRGDSPYHACHADARFRSSGNSQRDSRQLCGCSPLVFQLQRDAPTFMRKRSAPSFV